MRKKIMILDYGMCNLLNVARAFEHVGAEVTITESPAEAADADRLVVPGVGAFQDSLAEIQRRGFDDLIRNFVQTERPFLGICVGMQMLFDTSEEFGEHKGLGIFPGKVQGIPKVTSDGHSQRVPHIGWNHLVQPESGREWSGSLLQDFVNQSPAVYFVHSFAAHPTQPSDRLADCLYGGHRVCAAVQRANVMATQFHPERSGKLGLGFLKNFVCI
jgi:imidazole glycerol-phosphate synthase subunit HisH